MSFADVAGYLGMHRESVRRALADLKRRGLVQHKGRRFVIRSLEALGAL